MSGYDFKFRDGAPAVTSDAWRTESGEYAIKRSVSDFCSRRSTVHSSLSTASSQLPARSGDAIAFAMSDIYV
jgi:hypothetical protein